MPTVLTLNGYRFFFYNNEHNPLHVHVEKDDAEAKFNLVPIELVNNYDFNSKEIRQIKDIIIEYQAYFIQQWNDYFN